MEKLECKNCGEVVVQQYCGACGQKYREEVTYRSLANEIYDGFFSFESPFLKSLFYLTINPGKVFREYMDGAQRRYFSPVRYSFWVLALVVAAAGFYDISLVPQSEQTKQDEFLSSITVFMNTIIIPLTFFGAYITSITTRFLFRKEKYTTVEWYSPVLLTFSHFALLSVPAMMLGWYEKADFIPLYLGVQSIYFTWGISSALVPAKFSNYVKGFLAALLGFIASTFVSSLAMAVLVVIQHIRG